MDTETRLLIKSYQYNTLNSGQPSELHLMMCRKDNITQFEVWKDDLLLLETDTRNDAQEFMDNLYYNRDMEQG